MLHRVNNSAILNVPTHGVYHLSNGGADTATPPIAEQEPAAIIDVSAKGQELAALQLRKLDPANPLFEFDGAFFSHEATAQRKAESLLEPDTSRKIHIVDPLDWTLNRLVQDVVNPKMDPTTANKFTSEIARLIQGTWDNNGNLTGTVEERAINREKGLELAKYIAENYIDTPDEKKNFVDGINRFYNNAVLRDKGYDVIEGPNGTIVKKPEPAFDVLTPGIDKAWKEAFATLSTAGAIDLSDKATLDALSNEAARVYLRNAGGKYAEIGAKFEAGEYNGVEVFYWIRKANYDESIRTGKRITDPSEKSFAEKEREVSSAIELVKNNTDMNAIKEDIQRTIREILSTFVSYDDYEKSMQEWKWAGLGASAGRIIGLPTSTT